MHSAGNQLASRMLTRAACPAGGPGATWLRLAAAAFSTARPRSTAAGEDAFSAPLTTLSEWWRSLQQTGTAPHGALNAQGLLEHTAGGRRLLYAEFQQGVRTRLAINAPADVTVTAGPMEATRIQVLEEGGPSSLAISHQAASPEAGRAEDTVTVSAAGAAAADGGPRRRIVAQIPERYASVEIHSHGGDVAVEAVNEAGLSVDTGGGAVRLGKVKASRAAISAGGGRLSARLLVAEAVEMEAGGVEVERLMGKRVAVAQQGGAAARPLRLTAAYVQDSLALDAGDADVQIGTLACEPGEARLSTGGGVSIDSLDGAASITAGGDASLHCHDGLRALSLAAGGSVRLRLSPALAGKAVVRAPAGVYLPEGAKGPQLLPEAGFELFDPEDVAVVAGQLGVPVIQLRVADGAAVDVAVESWIEALERRTRDGGKDV